MFKNWSSRVYFSLALKNNKLLAMSILFKKNNTLYGRYWGSLDYIKNLHFNVCYYKPIEWCIENNIKYYDVGMGGSHKLNRGFELNYNYSAHYHFNNIMNKIFKNGVKYFNNKIK